MNLRVMTKGRITAILLNLGLIIYSAVGAQVNSKITPYVVIGVVFILCFLSAFKYIKQKDYPIYLFGVGLSLLYSVSMLGLHVVGADISKELFVSRQILQEGFNLNNPDLGIYGSSIVLTLLAPGLSRLLNLNLTWVYKLIFPIFLAGTIPLLYLTWKTQIGEQKAWWAAILFGITPVLTLEIIGIAKSMVAEFLLAGTLLLLVSKINWKPKTVGLTVLTILCMLCHYVIGIMLLGFLSIGVVILGIGTWRKWNIFNAGKKALVTLLIVVSISGITGYYYFSNVAEGKVSNVVVEVAHSTTNIRENIDKIEKDQIKALIESQKYVETPEYPESSVTIEPSATATEEYSLNIFSYILGQSPLVKAGIALDLTKVHGWGLAFRLIQYLIELLMVLGLIFYLIKPKRYNFTPEFIAGVIGAVLMLACCIFLPSFSLLINMTRFYQLSLFFLAPFCIVGIDIIGTSIRKDKIKNWLACGILVVYFVFTSGLVFKFAGYKELSIQSTPPGIALSNERIGLFGVHYEGDLECAEWLAYESKNIPIISGLHGGRLLCSYIPSFPRLFKELQDYRLITVGNLWNPPEADNYYIFLTERNVTEGVAMTYGKDFIAGTRDSGDIPDWIWQIPEVFKSGKSKVLEVTNVE